MSRNMCNILHDLKPAMMMVVVQVAYAGVNLLYKLAANDGMNLKVLVVYRLTFATVFIVPLALILERKTRPKLTWVVFFQAFLCASFGPVIVVTAIWLLINAYWGYLAQILFLESLALTSSTYTTAMFNLIPAATFLLAICFRLERLGFGNLGGKVKVFGTLMGLGGAMLLTLYKGAEINIWSTHLHFLHPGQPHGTNATSPNKLLGTLYAVGSCLSFALWLIIQAKMSERYPCHYSSTALMNAIASIQAVVFALSTERDWSQWKLGWNIRLLTAAYTGIVASGAMVVLISWCVTRKGPLFVSVFNPLTLVIVAIVGSLILDEKLHLGSVLGSILIVCGLYLVLWGKDQEIKRLNQLVPLKNSEESIEVVITSTANNNNINTEPTMDDGALDGDSLDEGKEKDEGRLSRDVVKF